jgi:hypothetical protein
MAHPRHTAAVAAVLTVALLSPAGATSAADQGGGRIRATELTSEHLTDPLSIDTAVPRLSWIDGSSDNGVSQTAYEIAVWTGQDRSGQMWE